jgi:chemotaxis protein CheD
MGETRISSRSDDRLLAIGLGACVGVCLYDATARVAAMVHIVLPQTPAALPSTSKQAAAHLPGKCADTAISNLIGEIEKAGAQIGRIRAAIVGGAQIFTPAPTSVQASPSAFTSRLEIGPRNVAAVKAGLAKARIPVMAEQTGGYCGRTVTFHVTGGQVFVRPIGAEERLLINLAERRADIPGKEGALHG